MMPLCASPSPESFLRTAIEKAVEREINLIIEEEVSSVAKRVEEKVRGAAGAIVARVLERFEMSRSGNTLVIRVEFFGTKNDEKQ